jgi:hypothetical protein
MVRLAFALMLFCGVQVEAQRGSGSAPLTLAVSAIRTAPRLHVILRNTSSAPVHVLLGYADGMGHESLDAISFQVMDARGKKMGMEPIDIPIAGTLKVINEVIFPGRAWSGDIELMNLALKAPLQNPITENTLPAGSYTIQAIFTGKSSDSPGESLPYWVGIVRSPWASYTVSN